MSPPDHDFRGRSRVSTPNWNFFGFTVVNCATRGVAQHGVSFLQFQEGVTAKARNIRVKFNSKTPISGSDFLRRGVGRQSKNKVVILFHTSAPLPFLAAAKNHCSLAGGSSTLTPPAVKINRHSHYVVKGTSNHHPDPCVVANYLPARWHRDFKTFSGCTPLELLHLHHGLKGPLGFCGVWIVEQLRQDLGNNLPASRSVVACGMSSHTPPSAA